MRRGLKILIATPLYPPESGGPSYYAKSLATSMRQMGHSVSVVHYGWAKKLPTGIRHLYFFVRMVFALPGADAVITLDTFSVGLPTVLATRLFGTRVVLRVGGDFLWESYVNRGGGDVPLPEFYTKERELSWKERMIQRLTMWTLKQADTVVFSTTWQRDLWMTPYNLQFKRIEIIENHISKPQNFRTDVPVQRDNTQKVFLWIGRDIPLKNIVRLKKAFEEATEHFPAMSLEVASGLSHTEVFERLTQCSVFVLPSISEVSPNLILEALSYGKPFIMTKHTGYRDMLDGLGIFVDPTNEQEIRDAMIQMTKTEVYEMYCKRVRKFAKTHSYDEIAQEFILLMPRYESS